MEHERISFEDHLSFKEIARAWSKASGDKPEMLMGTFVAAFGVEISSVMGGPDCSSC
jgi:hypothetical protein